MFVMDLREIATPSSSTLLYSCVTANLIKFMKLEWVTDTELRHQGKD